MAPPPLLVSVDRRGRSDFGPGWQPARAMADRFIRAGVPAVLVDINEELTRTLRRWPESPFFVVADTFADGSPNREHHPQPFGLRRALEQHGRPYLGSTYDAYRCSSSGDKIAAREILASRVALPRGIAVRGGDAARAAAKIARELRFPVVVKRARNSGASIGVDLARDEAELRTVLRARLAADPPLVVEEYVAGRELSVWILELGRDAEAFGIVEVHKRTAILTQRGKVLGRTGRPGKTIAEALFETPPRLSQLLRRRVEDAALAAHDALGLRHYSRVDLIVREGVPYVLDVNARPQIGGEGLGAVARSRRKRLDTVLRGLVRRHLPGLCA